MPHQRDTDHPGRNSPDAVGRPRRPARVKLAGAAMALFIGGGTVGVVLDQAADEQSPDGTSTSIEDTSA